MRGVDEVTVTSASGGLRKKTSASPLRHWCEGVEVGESAGGRCGWRRHCSVGTDALPGALTSPVETHDHVIM